MSISIFQFIAIIEERILEHRQQLMDTLGAEMETKRILNFVNNTCSLQILLPDTEKNEPVLTGSINAQAIRHEGDREAIKCKLTWIPAKRTEQHFLVMEEGKDSLRKAAVIMAESMLEFMKNKDKSSPKIDHLESTIARNKQTKNADPTSAESISTETIQATIDAVRSETPNISEETVPEPTTDKENASDIPKIGVEEVLGQLGVKMESS